MPSPGILDSELGVSNFSLSGVAKAITSQTLRLLAAQPCVPLCGRRKPGLNELSHKRERDEICSEVWLHSSSWLRLFLLLREAPNVLIIAFFLFKLL